MYTYKIFKNIRINYCKICVHMVLYSHREERNPGKLENGTGKRKPSKEENIMKEIKGLQEAWAEIKSCPKRRDCYYEVFYNRETGEVSTNFQVSLGANSWVEYRNKNIVKVGDFNRQTTKAEFMHAIDIVEK